ncbi:MAG: SpoIIAA family protein [Planctomycetota bacterium]|jgi:hypothetical protein
MSLETIESADGRVVEIHVSDRLTGAMYDEFVPLVDRAIERHGKARLLFHMDDFHGWDAGAMWQDTKFGVTHFTKLDRIAFVGDKDWEKWMATLAKPFTTAKVRYFDAADLEEARAWITEE